MNAPLLAIDTSGPRLQLALAGDDDVDVHSESLPRGHAEVLFGRLETFLGRHRLAYADLGRLAVTVGPGSFTGLRIGIAAARGLGLALDVPVIGVPNLLALSLAVENGPVDVVINARRNESYVQSFSAPGVPAGPPGLLPTETAEADHPRPGAILVTDPVIDMASLAAFARAATPDDFPPAPLYVRPADAKPQGGARIARRSETAG